MGANQFVTRRRGENMQDAFNKAVEDANEEYGHQEGYSGQINCHHSFRDKTVEFKASKLSLEKFIDKAFDEEKVTKHDHPWGICTMEPVRNTNKVKTQVEHVVEKGTKKWVQKFRVSNYVSHKDFNKKGDAVTYARQQCEKTKETHHIDIIKVLEKGSNRTAIVKYKPSPKESEGSYVFFGEAST